MTGSKDNSDDAKPKMNDSAVSVLNDIAARLIQLSGNEEDELEEIRYQLLELVQKSNLPKDITAVSAEALVKLDQLLYSESPAKEKTLEEVTGLVAAALNSSDDRDRNPEKVERSRQKPIEKPQIQLTSSLPEDIDQELLDDFIAESNELIEAAEASLLELELDPEERESVDTVFRCFHTIKGSSGFLGLVDISELAHKAESLLSEIRDGHIRYGGKSAELALQSVDLTKELIHLIQAVLNGDPWSIPEGYDDLISNLSDLTELTTESETFESQNPPLRLGDLLVQQGAVKREDIEIVASQKGDEPLGKALVKFKKASAQDVAKALRAQRRTNDRTDSSKDATLRVKTDRLDRLIDMVGELVISHSMLAQDPTVLDLRNQELSRKAARTGRIVRELQDLSMSMRMVPLKATFQKLHRLVRDLSLKAGKEIRLHTQGEETEIDRNMVDFIRDPLIHMIRNAVDHGIELPEERKSKSKPLQGLITLQASHSGGNVVVELQDDGRGLNRERILQKAKSQGIIQSATGLTDKEVFKLILEPGFSTADTVTDISGRGVGMDVVNRNIESLRGRIEISSKPGQGCHFKVYLPLTLAITDVMLVGVGEERYLIPTSHIVKSFKPVEDELSTLLERGEMVTIRGELLPLYRLHRIFDVERAEENPMEALLVVITSGDFRYALLVDGLLGQQQVVAKSLGKGIGKVPGVSGAAILGDGKVGLILDVIELARLARQGTAHYRKSSPSPEQPSFIN